MEKRIGAGILAALAIVALSILWLQAHYDPTQWRAQSSQALEEKSSTPPHVADSAAVDGLVPMSSPEQYDAATLSDKIDGKAELYLSAGFKSMLSQRFALAQDSTQWMERFIYDMGSYSNAFAVFSRQRRENARPQDLTPDAYQAANGLFLAQGQYYLEIVGSSQAPELMEKMISLAREFVRQHPAAASQRDERALFPAQDLSAGSIKLSPVNAFGFERLNRIYSAEYQMAGQTATAFLSRRASEAEAAELAKAYTDYLITYGGKRLEAQGQTSSMQVIQILDMIEVIFHQGPYLAGVHEAPNVDLAMKLAQRLQTSLSNNHEDARPQP